MRQCACTATGVQAAGLGQPRAQLAHHLFVEKVSGRPCGAVENDHPDRVRSDVHDADARQVAGFRVVDQRFAEGPPTGNIRGDVLIHVHPSVSTSRMRNRRFRVNRLHRDHCRMPPARAWPVFALFRAFPQAQACPVARRPRRRVRTAGPYAAPDMSEHPGQASIDGPGTAWPEPPPKARHRAVRARRDAHPRPGFADPAGQAARTGGANLPVIRIAFPSARTRLCR